MNSDHSFKIGTGHQVCEDFVVSGTTEDGEVYTFLSDGCSGSKDTDIGSRILCLLSKKRFIGKEKENEDIFLSSARIIAELMQVDTSCLDATLLSAWTKEDKVFVNIFGDGAFAFKIKAENFIRIISFDYARNYPFFLNYKANNDLLFGWRALQGNLFSFEQIILNEDKTTQESQLPTTLHHHITFDITPIGSSFIFDKSIIDFVVVMSDGIASFCETVITETFKESNLVSYQEVLGDLLSFKNFKGKFVERRVNKFLNDYRKLNRHHIDDLSIGVVYIGEK